MAGLGEARRVTGRQARRGRAGKGSDGQGMAMQAGLATVRPGVDRQGRRGMARHGGDGRAGRSKAGVARQGEE